MSINRKCREVGLCEKGAASATEMGIGEFEAQAICVRGRVEARDFSGGFNDMLTADKVAALDCGIVATSVFLAAGDWEEGQW